MYKVLVIGDISEEEMNNVIEDFSADEGRPPTEEEIKDFFLDVADEAIRQGDLIELLDIAGVRLRYKGEWL